MRLEELLTVVSHARDSGLKHIRVFTNGRLLAYQAVSARLMAAGMTGIDVSLHGANALIHEWATHTPGSFLQTVKGARRAAKAGADLAIHTVLLRSNYRDLAALMNLARRLGASNVHVRFPTIEGELLEAGAMPSRVPRYSVVRTYLEEAITVAGTLGLNVLLHGFPDCQLPPHLRPLIQRDATRWLGLPSTWHRSEKTFPDVCTPCASRDQCQGIDPQYLDYVGPSELRPSERSSEG